MLALITPFLLGAQTGSSLRFEGVLWVRPHSEQGLAVAPEGENRLAWRQEDKVERVQNEAFV